MHVLNSYNYVFCIMHNDKCLIIVKAGNMFGIATTEIYLIATHVLYIVLFYDCTQTL